MPSVGAGAGQEKRKAPVGVARPLDPELCRRIMDSQRWVDGVARGGAGQQRYPGISGPCWIWNGSVVRNSGYGMVGFGGERYSVHRVALVVALGRDIRPDRIVGHLCHDAAVAAGMCQRGVCYHRRCVNPSHLAEQRPVDNALMARGAGYLQQAAAARRDGL